MSDVEKYIAALRAARLAGEAAAAAGDDRGASNFDTAAVYFPKGTPPSTIEAVILAAGFKSAPKFAAKDWRGAYKLYIEGAGQGASGTRAAQAVEASIKTSNSGLKSSVYYQLD